MYYKYFLKITQVIQRKHITCWSKILTQEQSTRKEEVFEKLNYRQGRGKLLLEKLPSDRITISY